MKTMQGKLSHHFEQEAHQHTFTFMDSYNRELDFISFYQTTYLQAKCRGVCPSLSLQSVRQAACSMRYLATSSFPPLTRER